MHHYHLASMTYESLTVCGLTTRLHKPKMMPEWSRAGPFEKLAEAYTGIHRMGGKVFTLRLHADAHSAIRGSKDPCREMIRRIRRQFKKHGLRMPHLAFSLEVTPDDRNELHVHGAILLGDLPLKQVKQALRDAAGLIVGRAGSRQVQIKNYDMHRGGPRGWALYVKPSATRTRRVIQHQRLTYISSELRKLCKVSWEQHRGQRIGYYHA